MVEEEVARRLAGVGHVAGYLKSVFEATDLNRRTFYYSQPPFQNLNRTIHIFFPKKSGERLRTRQV